MSTYQRSIWNDHTSDLAVDDDASTCYVSGYDIGAWWYVDMGQHVVVDGVIISGWFCRLVLLIFAHSSFTSGLD